MVLFGLKERLCRGVIAWQLTYALQVHKWELAIALCQWDQGKTGTSTYKSAFVRFLQG